MQQKGILSALMFMLCGLASFTSVSANAAKMNTQEIDVSGILLVNTISRQGHEFARQFSTYWQDIPNTSGLNVQIKEIIVPSAGTRLTVNLLYQPIYATYMGRRQSPVKEKVEQAVLTLVTAMSRVNDNNNNPDLAKDEW